MPKTLSIKTSNGDRFIHTLSPTSFLKQNLAVKEGLPMPFSLDTFSFPEYRMINWVEIEILDTKTVQEFKNTAISEIAFIPEYIQIDWYWKPN